MEKMKEGPLSHTRLFTPDSPVPERKFQPGSECVLEEKNFDIIYF